MNKVPLFTLKHTAKTAEQTLIFINYLIKLEPLIWYL